MIQEKQIIQLDNSLLLQCRACAMQRDSNRKNSTDYSSDKTNDKGEWSRIGVIGEIALLRYFNIHPNWNYLSTDEGFAGVDVGDFWEVRATKKQTNRLFLWSDEINKIEKLAYAWSKIVVDQETGICELSGWAMGYEIAEYGIHDKKDCKRSSYFLSNDKLRPHEDPVLDNDKAMYLHYQFLKENV